MRAVFIIVLVVAVSGGTLSVAGGASAGGQPIYVNGVLLGDHAVRGLENHYGTSIPAGRYWYDRRAGLWGYEGGPAAGQIQAGLKLGGRLAADVSHGDSPIRINGRRLQRSEVVALHGIVGPIAPGDYWLDAQGNAGLEGGPALMNVVAAARQRVSDWNRNTVGGNWGGDSNGCSYFSHPGGSSVMIGDC